MIISIIIIAVVSFAVDVFTQRAVINVTGFSVSAVASGCMKAAVLNICTVPGVRALCRRLISWQGHTLMMFWFSFL